MATTVPNVDFCIYPSIIHVQQLNPTQLDQQAQQILYNLTNCSPLFSFQVNLMQFEHCNVRFSEKQVERIDENFYSYSIGTRFRLNLPSITPPNNLRSLIFKYFSGDVSGDIGEALFTYFLINVVNLQSTDIGHLRPAKNAGFVTPDFLIVDNTTSLSPMLPNRKHSLPFLAEVKAFTGPIDPARISHGLHQLQTGLINTSLVGLLVLVVRNEQRPGYDLYLVEVEN